MFKSKSLPCRFLLYFRLFRTRKILYQIRTKALRIHFYKVFLKKGCRGKNFFQKSFFPGKHSPVLILTCLLATADIVSFEGENTVVHAEDTVCMVGDGQVMRYHDKGLTHFFSGL